MGRIRLLGVGVLVLCLGLPSPAAAQGPGLFVRAVCTTITGPVVGETWCFDSTAQLLKVWNGATYVAAAGLTAPVLVSQGGTNLTSGTDGGILGFTAAGTLASSTLLTAKALVVGGGAGATPTTIAALTNGQLAIGSTGANPAPATLTAGDSLSVTNAAGAITLAGPLYTPGGRLTLTTASPVMTANVAASTSIFYALYLHDKIPIYDGTTWVLTTFTELTNTTTDNTKNPAAVGNNSNYDLFVWSDSGTIRLGRGPAWTSDTARGTGAGTTELIRQNGMWQNKIAITNGPAANRGTYVGTVRSNGTATIDWHIGAISANGTAATLHVWNTYNRVSVSTFTGDSTDNWTYQTNTWRASNASATMRCTFVRGLDEEGVLAQGNSIDTAGAASSLRTGMGLDTTTSWTGITSFNNVAGTISQSGIATYSGLPGLGYHYISANEIAPITAAASTFYGDAGLPDLQSGFTISTRQ